MASTGAIGGPAAAGQAQRAASYRVEVIHDWSLARPGWETALATGTATPFQHGAVMDAWYRAMAGRKGLSPLLVTVRDGAGVHALSLALVRYRAGANRVIAFADGGLIDYNAPILGPAAPEDAAGAARLWRAVRRALPAADLLDLRKMPERIGGRPNPFSLLAPLPCALNGNVVRAGDDWNAYHHSLKRTVRKELERSWRVFERHPGAAFRAVTDPAERQRVLAAIEAQQPVRMQSTHKTYVLDEPAAASFYRNLVADAQAGEAVVLTALTAGEEVVAALLGLRWRGDYIMVRISNAEGEWANASPGKIIIDKSMEWLHGHGQREFDFSIGNYDYKRRFGVEPFALIDLVRPLSPLGLWSVLDARTRAWLRGHPQVRGMAQRVRAHVTRG